MTGWQVLPLLMTKPTATCLHRKPTWIIHSLLPTHKEATPGTRTGHSQQLWCRSHSSTSCIIHFLFRGCSKTPIYSAVPYISVRLGSGDRNIQRHALSVLIRGNDIRSSVHYSFLISTDQHKANEQQVTWKSAQNTPPNVKDEWWLQGTLGFVPRVN